MRTGYERSGKEDGGEEAGSRGKGRDQRWRSRVDSGGTRAYREGGSSSFTVSLLHEVMGCVWGTSIEPSAQEASDRQEMNKE